MHGRTVELSGVQATTTLRKPFAFWITRVSPLVFMRVDSSWQHIGYYASQHWLQFEYLPCLATVTSRPGSMKSRCRFLRPLPTQNRQRDFIGIGQVRFGFGGHLCICIQHLQLKRISDLAIAMSEELDWRCGIRSQEFTRVLDL